MSVSKNNRQGAGDGIVVQAAPSAARKRRLQVPSSRKFATRGVVANPKLQEKLATALGEYHRTAPIVHPQLQQQGPPPPPPAALKRRSLSMAEINGVKDGYPRKAGERHVAPSALYLDARADAFAAAATAVDDAERRRVDAARRVCQQLALNAWRRRRAELASVVESRDRIQTQIEQLQLQVDALQELRSFEADRRRETNGKNRELSTQFDEMMHSNLLLKQKQQSLEAKLEASEVAAVKTNEKYLNERNTKITLEIDLQTKINELLIEKERVKSLNNEVQQLMQQITNFENENIKHLEEKESYEKIILQAEEKHKTALSDCDHLRDEVLHALCKNNELIEENSALEEKVDIARLKHEALENKLAAAKQVAAECDALKKQTQDENDRLRMVIENLQNDFRELKERQWWLKTGEFLFDKFAYCAYMVFPALPRDR